ncbi:MAG: HD-GYP domain-containing protein [Chloroflexi bacterium]|nr:HD-GYP domain-containing protein [Chloroflexota bacterium]
MVTSGMQRRVIWSILPGATGTLDWTPEMSKMIHPFSVETDNAELRIWDYNVPERTWKKMPRTKVEHKYKNDQLMRLLEISIALNSTLDLDKILTYIIQTAAEVLKCEAVSILLYDPVKSDLFFVASSASDPIKLSEIPVPLNESLAGKIFLENTPLILNNVENDPRHYVIAAQHVNFHTHSLLGVPMRIQDQGVGVLEALNKNSGVFTVADEWVLSIIASQAAVAIRNVKLLKDLELAYDTTLEGWSNVLDLRDEETEGHTIRVAKLTLQMARELGISEEELAHIHRGALLHDIGKMAIPDRILLKPGPLTKKEWEVMRQHPVFAYNFLSPITYLRPAIDIPYCHHEKLDGKGYPRGLKGSEIPFSARVFAVVDVWDALTSNRPYRTAWSKEQTLDYIREKVGTHFDPRVVEAFLDIDQ